MISRCDSAAMVPNTSELLPEPDTPVNTVSRRFGISTLTSLRLFTRAPCTRITSWLSAAAAPDDDAEVAFFAFVVLAAVFEAMVSGSPSVGGAGGWAGGPAAQPAVGTGDCWMRSMLPAGSRTAKSRTP